MEKKKTLGYKTLLTSLVSASIFLSVSAQEVSATEENINEKEVKEQVVESDKQGLLDTIEDSTEIFESNSENSLLSDLEFMSPKIVDIVLDKTKFVPGEMVTGYAVLEESTQMDYLIVNFNNDNPYGIQQLSTNIVLGELTINEEGQYAGSFSIKLPENLDTTFFTLYSVETADERGNQSTFYSTDESWFENISFDVQTLNESFEEIKEKNHTYEEEIPYEIVYVDNPDILVGTEEVTQEGVNGTRTIVEEITTVNGEETNRRVVSEEVTTEPVNMVIQVGTKAAVIEDIAHSIKFIDIKANKNEFKPGETMELEIILKTLNEEGPYYLDVDYITKDYQYIHESTHYFEYLGENLYKARIDLLIPDISSQDIKLNYIRTREKDKNHIYHYGFESDYNLNYRIINPNYEEKIDPVIYEVYFEDDIIDQTENTKLIIISNFDETMNYYIDTSLYNDELNEQFSRHYGQEQLEDGKTKSTILIRGSELSSGEFQASYIRVKDIFSYYYYFYDSVRDLKLTVVDHHNDYIEEKIPYETVYVNNSNLLVGTEKVSQDGIDGLLTIVEKVQTIDEDEIARKEISREITKDPVDKIIQVGTKAYKIEDIASGIREESRFEEVAFELEYINNPNLDVGTQQVSREGVNGVRTIVEKVNVVNGEEVSREKISDEVTTAPINKVIEIGTKAIVIEDIATVVKEETRTDEIPFDIDHVLNPDLYIGTEKVIQEGLNGVLNIIEKVTTVGGEEINREVISEEVISAPINQIIEIGTMYKDRTILNEITIYDMDTDNRIGTISIVGQSYLEQLNEYLNDINEGSDVQFNIVNQSLLDTSNASVIRDGVVMYEHTRNKLRVLVQNIADNTYRPTYPEMLSSKRIVEDDFYERAHREFNIFYNGNKIYENEYIYNETHDEAIRYVIDDLNSFYPDQFYFDYLTLSQRYMIRASSDGFNYRGVGYIYEIHVGSFSDLFSYEVINNEIPYEVIYEYNPDILIGNEVVSQEGMSGLEEIIEEIIIINGYEVSRDLIEQNIVRVPVDKVIQVGTKAAPIEDIATKVTEETRTEEVKYEIVYVENPELLVGTEVVLQEGVSGNRLIVEKVKTVGGKETEREVISTEVTALPVNKVIQIGTKAIKKETRTEEVAFEIEYVDNPNLLIGTEEVSQEGIAGILTIIEEVTTIDDKETNRELLSKDLTSEPVNKIIQVGTKAAVLEDIATIQDGWKTEDNHWVYYKDNEKLRGWQFINSHWYFMDSSGYMETGWTRVGNTWYYLTNSGAMSTGWTKINSTWYYLSGSGAMQTSWTKVGNTWYYMNSSGAMQTGWTKAGSIWYYMNSSGAMQTGWTKVGNTWYYMNSSGAMQTGWTQVGNTWYYLSGSGAMQTGWTKVGNTWYYMNSSGAMQTGWLKLGDAWYYLNSDGSMQTASARINGVWYQFDRSGRML